MSLMQDRKLYTILGILQYSSSQYIYLEMMYSMLGNKS